ncbi:MAG: PilZ domain-containing protein [Nitrospirae bacterium]|nr:PilZ domain-containing protein [Nitrospirota bacterium]
MADEDSAGHHDNRWGVRIPLGVLAKIRGGQGERLAKIRDISISGCFIETSVPYALGATVGLSFALDPDNPQTVTTDAKVTTRTQNGIGVRFIYSDADTPLMVRRWIASRSPAS